MKLVQLTPSSIASFFILVESLGNDTVYSTPLTEGSGTTSWRNACSGSCCIEKRKTIPITQDFTVKTGVDYSDRVSPPKALSPIFEPIPLTFPSKVWAADLVKRNWKIQCFYAVRYWKRTPLTAPLLFIVRKIKLLRSPLRSMIKHQSNPVILSTVSWTLELLDVYYRSVVMKKNRPGLNYSSWFKEVSWKIFQPSCSKKPVPLVFDTKQVDRKVMQRRFEQIDTEFGPVTVKLTTVRIYY